MVISFQPQKDFPLGNNIHFACSLRSGKFLFIHRSLDWVFLGNPEKDVKILASVIEPDDAGDLQHDLRQLLAGNFSGRVTVKLLGPQGPKWLHVVPFLCEIQDEQVIAGSVVDVTAETHNMQTINKFTDKKNSILNMLGHDLRGPLNIAKSLMKTITMRLDDPLMLEKTEHITTILQESIDMISDLVRREFLETTGAELARKRVDIVKLMRYYLEECKRSESISAINFELNSSHDSIFIKLDHAKFMQVVNNLISNSLKFTPSGGTVSVTIEDSGEEVNFTFSDTGIGIPKALLPEIFDKFTAARRPGLHGEPTTGLGLSIVKTIINWHNGRISCESIEGAGTRFFISLPKGMQT